MNNEFYINLHKYFISREFDCSNRLNVVELRLFRNKYPDFNQLYEYYSIKLEKQILSQIYKDISYLISEALKNEK